MGFAIRLMAAMCRGGLDMTVISMPSAATISDTIAKMLACVGVRVGEVERGVGWATLDAAQWPIFN